jgi:hypothetical protein
MRVVALVCLLLAACGYETDEEEAARICRPIHNQANFENCYSNQLARQADSRDAQWQIIGASTVQRPRRCRA